MKGAAACCLALLACGLPAARAPATVAALRRRRCNFQTWSVPEQGTLSFEEFHSRFPAGVPRPGEGPLLVKGGAADAKIVAGAARWTPQHLGEVAGGAKLLALEHSRSTAGGLFHYTRGGPTREMTLAEFLTTSGRNGSDYGDEYVFQRTHFTDPSWGGIGADVEAPAWTGASFAKQESFFSIGPVGSGLAFHEHGEAWNVITSGAKWSEHPRVATALMRLCATALCATA